MNFDQNIGIEEALSFVNQKDISSVYLMQSEYTMKLLGLLAYDNTGLRNLLIIVKNTIKHCETILGDNSTSSREEMELARSVVDKQREIKIGIESLLN